MLVASREAALGSCHSDKESAVDAQSDSNGRPTLLKALFILVASLVLGAIGYAGWIVISYWDRVGV